MSRPQSNAPGFAGGWLTIAKALLFVAVIQRTNVLLAAPQDYVWKMAEVDFPNWIAQMQDRGLAIDAAGHPHLVYGGEGLVHAWHDGTGWFREVVDPSPSVGSYASLAIGIRDRLHISYYDAANQDLRYALRDSTGWHLDAVDGNGDVGMHSAIAVDAVGNPHISYCAAGAYDLKYAVVHP
ncbi:MAG: hypothetical protein MUE60_10370, partial [Candidatus Eisenbacteria bacterium]|nr:hypothetical protein [Candidatus Eisenbacteria bacterium]